MFDWLFKAHQRKARFIEVQLNARLQPVHRGEHFEDPLDEALKEAGLGEVEGGGSFLSEEGEIECCDIHLRITGPTDAATELILSTLSRLGAPRGSKIHLESRKRTLECGETEGLAVYLNGTDLPSQVYEQCDSNVVYESFERDLIGAGRVLSFWQGPRETALYMYGHSFEAMKARLMPFISSYPLCARCRIERIA